MTVPQQIGADDIGDLEALRGVRAYPVRVKCATLVWNALLEGLCRTAATPVAITRMRNETTEPVSTTEPAAVQKEAKGVGRPIRAALSEVYDPEIGIDIVSLGFIYDTNIDDDGLLTIDMTLTTPYCPMGPIIETQAHAGLLLPLPGVRDVHINLVWGLHLAVSPAPWPPDAGPEAVARDRRPRTPASASGIVC